jgi:1-acyl-sn-glycerol-3-phosphate acyltransferase
VLTGAYADLLWVDLVRGELDAPGLAPIWDRRLGEAAADVGGLVRHVRGGGALILFPHGEISADGAVGEVDPRVGRLLHVARPAAVQPLAVAYDPLVRGPARAVVGVGMPIEPPARRGGERRVVEALRKTMPLTCGQLLAHELAARGGEGRRGDLAAALERALERARYEGRPIDPLLETAGRRRRRLDRALRLARRRGSDQALARASRSYASTVEAGG